MFKIFNNDNIVHTFLSHPLSTDFSRPNRHFANRRLADSDRGFDDSNVALNDTEYISAYVAKIATGIGNSGCWINELASNWSI